MTHANVAERPRAPHPRPPAPVDAPPSRTTSTARPNPAALAQNARLRVALTGARGHPMLSFARTKIQPPRPRPGALLARRELLARMRDALMSQPLVLVCAAAGFGKTSLLTQAIAQLPADTALAWVGCDEGDSPLQLFSCLVSALDPYDLPWRTAPEALIAAALASDQGPAAQAKALRAMATELINALDASEVAHGVIMVDDLHRVEHPAVHAFLDLLLERFTPRWTMAISSRHDPPIALARLRARGEVAEFRPIDLRFDVEQARQLAERAGLDAAAAEALFDRTQGWPAGLQLALNVLRSAPGASLAGSAGLIDRQVFDFVATEVLDRLPAELRDFLLATSVLPELTASRCAALTGDARAADKIEAIERAGLFVTTLPEPETTLRLHDLFRDALEHRLARERPEALPGLLRRAAATEQDGLRRVGALLRAGAIDEAEAALVEVGEALMTEGAAAAVQGLYERFPAPRREASPGLQLLRTQLAWARWDWAEMALASAAAVAAHERLADPTALAKARAYRCIALAGNGQIEASRALIDQLLADPAPDDAVAARALLAAGWIELARGDQRALAPLWSRLMDHLERLPSEVRWYECMPLPPFIGMPGMREPLWRYVHGAALRWSERPTPPRGMCTVIEGLLHLWSGDIARAQACATQAAEDSRWLAHPVNLHSHSGLLQSLVWALQGRSDEAQALVAHFIDAVRESGESMRVRIYVGLYLFMAMRCAAAADDDPTTRRTAERLIEHQRRQEGWLSNQHMASASAHLAAAEGRLDAACEVWRALLADEHASDLYGQVVETRLRLADGLLRLGHPAADAAAALAPAFERIDASGEWGPVLLAGERVLTRLAAGPVVALLPATDGARLRQWAARVRELRRARSGLASLAPVAAAMPAVAAAAAPTYTPAATAQAWASAPAAAPGLAAGTAAPPSAPGSLDGSAPSALAASALLSSRELEVLARMAAGDSNKLIARAFELSPHTVKRHVANILDKLALRSRGQAAAWYHAQGR